MSKYEFLQPRFTEGVLARSLQGRSSEEFYSYGFKSSKNMIPMVSGPLVKRPGTNYIGEALNNTSRFIPFFKDQDNTYILELSLVGGSCTLRVWSQDQLLNTHGSTTPYSITTSAWTTQEHLDSLKSTQSGDIIFVCCPLKPPQKISRTLASSGTRAADGSVWAFSEYVMEDGPYNAVNVYSKVTGKKGYSLSSPSPSTLIDVAKVEFNTINNSIVLASHGLQAGMKIRLDDKGATSSTYSTAHDNNGDQHGWGYLTTDGNHDGSTVLTDRDYWVVSSDATSFQVATADGDEPLEFELQKVSSSGAAQTKANASIMLQRYVYEENIDVTFTIYNKKSNSTANNNIARELLSTADEGRLIRINPLSKPGENVGGIRWAWGVIKTYTANSGGIPPTAIVTLKTELSGTRGAWGTSEFRLGAFSDSQGWPQVSQIYQQRMVLAANTFQPSTIWLSRTGDFYSFSPTEILDQDSPAAIVDGIATEVITDSNGLTFTLDSDTLDAIKWLGESKKLAMGTSAGVYMLYGSETNLVVTPFRFTINRETSFSATDTAPIVVSNALIYPQIGGKDLQMLSLNKGQSGQWDASKISLKGYDIIKSSEITKLVWQERPNGIIWCLMADGRLLSLSFDVRLEFMAWAEHVIGGTDAKVLDIEMIPRASHDQIWMKISRTIDGGTKYYVETLGRFPSEGALVRNDYIFSDSAVTKDVGSDKVVSGLKHLKGQTVQVYYDGMQHVDKTVTTTGGSDETITLNHTEGSRAVAGLSYSAEMDTLEPPAPEHQFSHSKRLSKIAVIIEESLGIQLDYNDLSEELLFRTMADAMGRQIPLFSGTRKLSLSGIGWDVHTVKIKSNGPLPMQLNAIIIESETGGS